MRPTALVVDDHPTFRRMARRLLTAAGYQVIGEAVDAASAIQAVRRSRPAFVLLDVLLPDGNGIEVAGQIEGPGAPRVLLTSSRSAGELGPALSGRAFLTKSELTVERLRGLAGDEWTDGGRVGPAVTALARRLGTPVDVSGIAAGRLPAAVESTAYFLICEALQNTVKHAQAGQARISVAQAGGLVQVEVSDDGIGGADPAAGSGLRGLADRIEAAGGRLTVESPPSGGTTVRAELPCG